MDHEYWMEGKVSIPEEKREEFNENILKLFFLCGIRKIKEREIGGQIITVVGGPEQDNKGIVRFDYSIFEGRKRQVSTYNMNTCELFAADCGYGEFSLVMNLVMTMQEAYSAGECYFMKKNKVCDVHGYALLIERTIGLRLSFPGRERIWDMFAFFKSSGKYEEMKYEEILRRFPYEYGHVNLEQFIACWISSQSEVKEPMQPFQGGKAELKQADFRQRIYYVYRVFQELILEKGKGKIRDFLKSLLDLELAERKQLARQTDGFGSIAEASLYELPACILAAYGWAADEDFWKVWDSLEITGYHDIYSTGKISHNSQKEEDKERQKKQEACKESEKKQEVRKQGTCKEPGKEPLFYQVILRENEDEFLEFWDNHELCLSDGMKGNLVEWKQEYENIGEAEAAEVDTERFLAEILQEMREIWWCRYVDEKLVQEFTAHSDHLQFQKALLVFRKMMDRDLEFFPELTARQVKEWVTRRCCSEKDRIKISGYASLLANPTGRCRLLGF